MAGFRQFALILAIVLRSQSFLMPLRMQGPLWVYNDSAKSYGNRMDSF